MTERACRVCGCTQNNACLTADGPCHLVAPDLCSGCAGVPRRSADNYRETICKTCGGMQILHRHGDYPAMCTSYIISSCPTKDACHKATVGRGFSTRHDPLIAGPKSDDPTLEPPKVG